LLQQRLLASECIFLDLEVRLGARDVGSGPRRLGPQLCRLKFGVGELRFSIFERDLERRRVDPEEDIAAFHPGAVANVDRLDGTGHLRAH
jgi:hypothetical protein